jgi:TRAP-type C4-dicarboxylate transport system permease large subunit
MPGDVVADTLYTSLLQHLGCTAYAHELAGLWGDDLSVTRLAHLTDFSSTADVWRTFVPGLAAASGTSRARALLTTVRAGPASDAGGRAWSYNNLVGGVVRSISWKAVWEATTETMLITTMIMIIIGFANSMGWLLAIQQVPQGLASAIPALVESTLFFLVVVMAAVLVIGCFIDGVTIKLLLVPILLPLVDSYGIDRVHFGIVLQMSIILGIATPPLGIGLYIVSRIAAIPVEDVVRSVIPYFLPLGIVLILIAAIPEISLWLPNYVMGQH